MTPNAQFQRFAKSRSRCISCSVTRTQICVLWGLGQRLNKRKPGISETSGMLGFSHLYIQMHCLLLPKNCCRWFSICVNASWDADQSESISAESISKPNSFNFCSMWSECNDRIWKNPVISMF